MNLTPVFASLAAEVSPDVFGKVFVVSFLATTLVGLIAVGSLLIGWGVLTGRLGP